MTVAHEPTLIAYDARARCWLPMMRGRGGVPAPDSEWRQDVEVRAWGQTASPALF